METTKPDNELIAEFMGMKHQIQVGPFGGEYLYVKNPVTKEFEIPKFEISWDWLMPVVEKIATIHRIDFSIKAYIGSGGIQVFDALADTQKSETISFIQEEEVGSLLSVTYKAVVEFIKWHNSQKL